MMYINSLQSNYSVNFQQKNKVISPAKAKKIIKRAQKFSECHKEVKKVNEELNAIINDYNNLRDCNASEYYIGIAAIEEKAEQIFKYITSPFMDGKLKFVGKYLNH